MAIDNAPGDVVYVDEPWVHLRWDRAHNCVRSEWKGFARERHATGCVSDSRKLKLIVLEDQKWANETTIPLLAAAGLKRQAMVTSQTGLGKLTVEEIVTMVDNKGLLMRTFDSLPAALSWVRQA